MFTGIIEAVGTVKEIIIKDSSKSYWIESILSHQLKADQSVNHSGVCLTIEEVMGNSHRITAVKETLSKTNMGNWNAGQLTNLERGTPVTGRLDGHIVQGHIDTTVICKKFQKKNGSLEYEFELPKKFSALIIEKGSIAINGISLTVFNVKKKSFRVAIIPFTYEHTDIRHINIGHPVNIEFDILGKYIQRHITLGKGK